MTFESVYSFLIGAAGFFLAIWVVFLLAAYARAFGGDSHPQKS